MDRLANVATVVDETHGFKFFDNRDLLGFVDGTENPENSDAEDAVRISAPSNSPYINGSYLIVQKYLHDMNAWKELNTEEQEKVIGRTKLDNVELDDATKPNNSHRLLPALRAARGTVVYLNSGAGRQAAAGWSAYSASKYAARGWCDALRAEEPEIRVTSVFPGRIATDMQRAIRAQEGLPYVPDEYLDPNTVARVVGDALETPRDASLTDVVVRPALPPLL